MINVNGLLACFCAKTAFFLNCGDMMARKHSIGSTFGNWLPKTAKLGILSWGSHKALLVPEWVNYTTSFQYVLVLLLT